MDGESGAGGEGRSLKPDEGQETAAGEQGRRHADLFCDREYWDFGDGSGPGGD